jgi:hypothetical protein
VVPTASSSNLLNGLPYSHHCDIPGLLASGMPIVPQLSTIFILRCDRILVMLNLLTAVDPSSPQKQPAEEIGCILIGAWGDKWNSWLRRVHQCQARNISLCS